MTTTNCQTQCANLGTDADIADCEAACFNTNVEELCQTVCANFGTDAEITDCKADCAATVLYLTTSCNALPLQCSSIAMSVGENCVTACAAADSTTCASDCIQSYTCNFDYTIIGMKANQLSVPAYCTEACSSANPGNPPFTNSCTQPLCYASCIDYRECMANEGQMGDCENAWKM